MSEPFTFAFGVHDHQPVGNFDHVIAQAHAAAYRPFLELLGRRPGIPVSLHHSGPLLEWLEQHDPDYLDRLGTLAARGQVEILGGAFYEPILPAIPHRDRVAQIRLQAAWSERRLAQRPRGAWLAERVWEPGLVTSLADAGVDFVALDDEHFRAAGLPESMLAGYVLTEDQGARVAVFPIDQRLRYLVPFESPEAVLAHLAARARAHPGGLAVLADDGEKFGVWPGTAERCYRDGWLERFFDALEGAVAEGWLRLSTLGDARLARAPAGLAYLPTTSYLEMTEWALPTAPQIEFHALRARLAGEAAGEAALVFVRGGFWRNFLVKYPEANFLHKRMLRLSEAADALPAGPAREQARVGLYRSQCNCAYWHGVFGGLYLPHLRDALHRSLIHGEAAVDAARGGGVSAEAADWNADGQMEARLAGPRLVAWLDSARGGALAGLDDRQAGFNYLNVLTRRPEPYHARLAEARAGGAEGRSIHDGLQVRAGVAIGTPVFDPSQRGGLIEHALDPAADLALWAAGRAPGDGAWTAIPAAMTHAAHAGRAEAGFERQVPLPGGELLTIAKTVELESDDGGDFLAVTWRVTHAEPHAVAFVWAVEFAASLLAPDAPDRTVRLTPAAWSGAEAGPASAEAGRGAPEPMGTEAADTGVTGILLEDAWQQRSLEVVFESPADLWRSPMWTVSLSEAGLERVYQGTLFLSRESVRIAAGETFVRRWRIESRRRGDPAHPRLAFTRAVSRAEVR